MKWKNYNRSDFANYKEPAKSTSKSIIDDELFCQILVIAWGIENVHCDYDPNHEVLAITEQNEDLDQKPDAITSIAGCFGKKTTKSEKKKSTFGKAQKKNIRQLAATTATAVTPHENNKNSEREISSLYLDWNHCRRQALGCHNIDFGLCRVWSNKHYLADNRNLLYNILTQLIQVNAVALAIALTIFVLSFRMMSIYGVCSRYDVATPSK